MATSAPRSVPKAVPRAAESGAAAPAAAGSRRLLYILLALVLLLAAGGAGAWFWFQHQAAEQAATPAMAKLAAPVFLPLDAFTVNLQSGSGDQFLQVAITLQVGAQADVDRLKLYMPQVRSRLLLHLSGKSADQIDTPDGKLKLAAEIAAMLRTPFAPGETAVKVGNVHFTSFVIQ